MKKEQKYINLLYSTETGKLDLEVTEQPEPGNFAKMDVTYMKATILKCMQEECILMD